jgi:serine O-acetyltransferase
MSSSSRQRVADPHERARETASAERAHDANGRLEGLTPIDPAAAGENRWPSRVEHASSLEPIADSEDSAAQAHPNAGEESDAWNLPELVSALRAARSQQSDWRRDEADRRQRPSREALLAIVKGLRAALFPSHFGQPELSDASIDFYVGNTLDGTLRALEEQVRRGLGYMTGHSSREASLIRRAHEIVREFAASLPGVRSALELDIRAAYHADPAALSRSEVILCYPGITAIIHHRLAHELYRLELPLLARVVSEIAHSSTGIEIHPGAQIGKSFFIDHGTGVVIGETAIIGDNVRLYQGVTLGARNFPVDEQGAALKGRLRHPIIGDDVVIYAGATILGRVTIGRGSTVGGNVWLTRSVPPDSHITQAHTRQEVFDDGAGI